MLAVSGLFKAKHKTDQVVGIEILADGVALVALNNEGISALEYFDKVPGNLGEILSPWVMKNQLQSAACHFVLSREAYQLLLVEPPEVPEEEIRSAIRWRLKDFISIPPEQAAVDVFPLPEDGTKAKKKMVYVVAAEIDKLKSIIDAVSQSGLELKTIDIAELAIRNLANKAVDEKQFDRGVAIARIGRGNGSVYIYRKGNIYLARSFNLKYNGGLLDELPQDDLALELQRSMDYYERQMGQVPPALIYICGEHISSEKIGATLKASMAIPMNVLSPQEFFPVSETCDLDNLPYCVAALGAAVRAKGSY